MIPALILMWLISGVVSLVAELDLMFSTEPLVIANLADFLGLAVATILIVSLGPVSSVLIVSSGKYQIW